MPPAVQIPAILDLTSESPVASSSTSGHILPPSPAGNGNGAARADSQEPEMAGLGGMGLNEVAVLLKTAEFAAIAHEHQRRKNQNATPYINHPLGVATILSTYGVTHLPTLQAALLHDTVEDTDVTIEIIAAEFGDEVARIVAECTDPPNTPASTRKALQTKTAAKKSKEAQQVKLGDKLHNLRSLREEVPVGWGVKRVQDYFVWAKSVTDICLPSLPLIAIPFNDIYTNGYFVLDGKAHKCHPGEGKNDGLLTEGEERHVKRMMERGKKERKFGWSSPIFT